MSNQPSSKLGSIKNNPKIMRAWAAYDWANSVYSLVITSTIFPIYSLFLPLSLKKKNISQSKIAG